MANFNETSQWVPVTKPENFDYNIAEKSTVVFNSTIPFVVGDYLINPTNNSGGVVYEKINGTTLNIARDTSTVFPNTGNMGNGTATHAYSSVTTTHGISNDVLQRLVDRTKFLEDRRIGNPATLSVSTTNTTSSVSHTHKIDAFSNNVTNSIMARDSNGNVAVNNVLGSLSLGQQDVVFSSSPSNGSLNNQSITAYRLAEFYHNVQTSTGAIVFSSPDLLTGASYKITIKINSTNIDSVPHTIELFFHVASGPAFVNPRKTCYGSSILPVRLALNASGKLSIILGTISQQWTRPHVTISCAQICGPANTSLQSHVKNWTTGLITTTAQWNSYTAPIIDVTELVDQSVNDHAAQPAPHSGHLNLNPSGGLDQTVSGTIVANKNSQDNWSQAGLISRSTTGNPSITLHSIGLTALQLRHIRGDRRLHVRDDLQQYAPVSAGNAVNNQDLMTFGQFREVVYLGNGANLNSVIKNGWYEGDNLVNRPSGTNWIRVMVIAHQSQLYAQQMAYDFFSDNIWTRRLVNGTWTAWVGIVENGLGQQQSWQNVTSQRSANTTYTNNTSKPIFISITTTGDNAGGQLFVNGLEVSNQSVYRYTNSLNHHTIVPVGATYRATLAAITSWRELR